MSIETKRITSYEGKVDVLPGCTIAEITQSKYYVAARRVLKRNRAPVTEDTSITTPIVSKTSAETMEMDEEVNDTSTSSSSFFKRQSTTSSYILPHV